MHPRPTLTVVVPCRNRPELVGRCVARLREVLAPGDRVIVADSASDGDAVRIAAENAGARAVRCDRPGTSRARNAGARAADTELVAFVDDDVMVTAGWADAMLAAFDGADVDFVIGHTGLPADHAGGRAATSVITVAPPEVIRSASSIGAAGGNVAFRRQAFDRAGGYDERLGPGTWSRAGEDLELLDRVLAAGGSGRYAAGAVATHEQWRAEDELLAMQWAYGKGMGARVACGLRRDPRAGLRLLPEVLRLRGLVTAVRRVRMRGEAPTGSHASASSPLGTGWAAPVCWRLGALVGLVVGLARLSPRRSSP